MSRFRKYGGEWLEFKKLRVTWTRPDEVMKALEQRGMSVSEMGPGHYRTYFPDGNYAQFWPSTGRFHYIGRTGGNADELAFILWVDSILRNGAPA